MIGLDVEALLEFSEFNELEAMELCDTLWLARYMKTEKEHYQVKKHKEVKIQKTSSSPSNQNTPKDNTVSNRPPIIKSQEIEEDGNMALSMGKIESSKQQSFYVPHKGYFENRTKLSMYLRDFKEKVHSRHNMVFNEEKTVDYIASTGISHVFLEPKKEKRYELYVVIDKSDSMVLWSEMLEDYSNLLLNSGVFASVRKVYIDTNSHQITFYNDKETQQVFSSYEMSNFHQRKLMFVLSDMLSVAWRMGDAFEVFAKLYEKIPIFVVQMLPHRLWRSTALNPFTISSLNTEIKYAIKHDFKSQIDYILESLKEEESERYKLPIVNFELSYLKVIGSVLQAKEGNSIDGAIVELNNSDNEAQQIEKFSSYEKVEIFFTNASFEAQELLKAFSAVPLNLAIMRMIQEKVIDETNNVYLAEVLNSQLLLKKDDFYEFLDDEVYAEVFKLLGKKDALEIAYKNSDYIQENLNARFGFKALLTGEIDLENIDFENNNEKIFASVSCKLLKHLGLEYAKKAGCQGKGKIKVITPTTKRFIMGSTERKEEQPIHEVIINYDFEISPTQVTVGEFKVFVEETDYVTEAEKGDGAYVYDSNDWTKKKDASWKNPYFEQTDEHPVVCVSWNDAQAYIAWLNEKTGETYRLPTEAEWEYACRAGATSKWHFGDDEKELEKYAWYRKNSDNRTHSVSTRKPNQWGLYDMHGNVWEWCQDDYITGYKGIFTDESIYEKEEKQIKVFRGASWVDMYQDTRSAGRGSRSLEDCSNFSGFRLLRTLP